MIGRLVAIFWLLGSALVAADVPRSAFVCTPARINTLNWLTSLDVPGYVRVLGSAHSNATVTLWSPAGPYQTPAGNFARPVRQGEYFAGELTPNNSTGAVWLAITNLAVRQNGTNTDYAATNVGYAFISQTPETYGYDQDGNLTNNGRWTISWDPENRATCFTSLTNAPPGSKRQVDCTYDYAWRRTQKIVSTNNGSIYEVQYTNRFVYDGWNLTAILDGGNNLLKSFVWGTDLSGTMQGAGGVGGLIAMRVHTGVLAGTYFYVHNGNGSVAALISASDGSVVARYDYSPFGEVLRATGPLATANPFLFSTKYYDWETGFYYYGYRYYDSSAGRWLSRDPIGEWGGFNLYGFVGNSPPNLVDPDGRNPLVIGALLLLLSLASTDLSPPPPLPPVYPPLPVYYPPGTAFIGPPQNSVVASDFLNAIGGAHIAGTPAEQEQAETAAAIITAPIGVGRIRCLTAAKGGGTSVLFGQRRIGPVFSTGEGVPAYLAGRPVSAVAADLRSGVLTADQLPINAFTGANGELITINNRTLSALSEAGLQPTRINMMTPTRNELLRLTETPIINSPIPGPSIPVTPSITDPTVLRVITIP